MEQPFMINILKRSQIKDMTRYNKGNIQQSDRQHQIKWRDTSCNSTKINYKTSLSTLSLSIQYNT